MWRDTREARLKRYREILAGSPRLYGATEAVRSEINVTDEFAKVLWTDRNQEKTSRNREADSASHILWTDRNQKETFEDVCDYVLAPALNGFVQWMLKEALDSGKKRLYFLARDGYLMYKGALVYCEKLNLPIECRYLSCSRYSIRIPMFQLDMEEAMDYICRGGIDVTMDKILNRAGLTEEEKGKILAGLDCNYEKDAVIPYADLAETRKKLEQEGYFAECVRKHSESAMPNLEGYLIQEGLFDGTPSALVDSGWVGSMQKVLNRLTGYIQEKNGFAGRPALEGYYWGLYELPPGVKAEEYHCYYFSPEENLREKVYFSNCLFEGIFSAPHGMTLGYERKEIGAHGRKDPDGGNETGYRPVYAVIPDAQKWFMEDTEQRLIGYTEKLVGSYLRTEQEEISDAGKVFDADSLRCDRQIVSRLLGIFMGEPTVWEAEVYGSLHFSDDVLDYGGHQMAEPMSQEELTANHLWHKTLAMLGIQKKHVKESAWYEGSAVRGGRTVKRHLRRYAGYKYLLYLRKKYQMRNLSGKERLD